MAKKTKNIPSAYTVRVRKADIIVDSVMAAVTIAAAVWVIIMMTQLHIGTQSYLQIFVGVIAVPIFLYLGLWHYPRYIFEKIEVQGDSITFHQLYFRRHQVTFRDIREIYTDGSKKDRKSLGTNGSHAVIIDYGKGRYRLPCDFCDAWNTLRTDLKYRGIAVK